MADTGVVEVAVQTTSLKQSLFLGFAGIQSKGLPSGCHMRYPTPTCPSSECSTNPVALSIPTLQRVGNSARFVKLCILYENVRSDTENGSLPSRKAAIEADIFLHVVKLGQETFSFVKNCRYER
jgi:hypothetical protein